MRFPSSKQFPQGFVIGRRDMALKESKRSENRPREGNPGTLAILTEPEGDCTVRRGGFSGFS